MSGFIERHGLSGYQRRPCINLTTNKQQIIWKTMMKRAARATRATFEPRIPLGRPRAGHVEYGETVQSYFRRKHSTQGYGKYHGLHEVDVAAPWLKQTTNNERFQHV
jgi:hypothetical protein